VEYRNPPSAPSARISLGHFDVTGVIVFRPPKERDHQRREYEEILLFGGTKGKPLRMSNRSREGAERHKAKA
jgi:hypothetical protein